MHTRTHAQAAKEGEGIKQELAQVEADHTFTH